MCVDLARHDFVTADEEGQEQDVEEEDQADESSGEHVAEFDPYQVDDTDAKNSGKEINGSVSSAQCRDSQAAA